MIAVDTNILVYAHREDKLHGVAELNRVQLEIRSFWDWLQSLS